MNGIPGGSDLVKPLEHLVRSRGEIQPKLAYQELARLFSLSRAQLQIQRGDGRPGSLFENRVQWAREELAKRGVIDRRCRRLWRLRQSTELTIEMMMEVAMERLDDS